MIQNGRGVACFVGGSGEVATLELPAQSRELPCQGLQGTPGKSCRESHGAHVALGPPLLGFGGGRLHITGGADGAEG